MKAILFSGAHGVGKGFFLDKVKEHIAQYEIYSASGLIGKYQKATDAGYKMVSDVKHNQEVLARAIREAQTSGVKDFILDGHLCIFNALGEVERISEDFFEVAQITGVILLQDDPSLICDRINSRDANKIDILAIKQMQDEECIYAKELEQRLQIRYAIITHECTGEQFAEVLRSVGGDLSE